MTDEEKFRDFLETTSKFHTKLSKHERLTGYVGAAGAIGAAAVTGTGIYIASSESDLEAGLITGGLGGYATILMTKITIDTFRRSKRNALRAEELSHQLEQLESSG